MSRNILWIFLATAPLVSASSLDENFQATCGATATEAYVCSGIYRSGTGYSFSFVGPFPGSPGFGNSQFPELYQPGEIPRAIDIGVGTRGGTFSFQGHTCNYGDVLGGVDCNGEVFLGAELGAPDDEGLSLGDVVSITGTGTAEGFFCWGCNGTPPRPVFDLQNVHATYQFTLTDPGMPAPFSWTAAQFSFGAAPVPEPGTWAFAILGLTGVAIGFRRPSNLRLRRTRVQRSALGVK